MHNLYCQIACLFPLIVILPKFACIKPLTKATYVLVINIKHQISEYGVAVQFSMIVLPSFCHSLHSAMNSGDRYKIIGFRKISHFTKQPCRNVCLKKAL